MKTTTTTSFTLPASLLADAHAKAHSMGLSLAAYLRHLIRQDLDKATLNPGPAPENPAG